MTVTGVYDLTIIIHEKICGMQDSKDSEFVKARIWLNGIIHQTLEESKIRKERCEICNSKEDPRDMEGHHVAGRKHDHRQITACKPCHRILSDMQKTWDKRWETENQSDGVKIAFFLSGLRDILVLKTRKTGNSIYEEIGLSFTETISELLKGG